MKICKILRFEASHVLPKHPGKCSRLHGHSYILEVEVEGAVNPDTGMVLDFATLSDLLQDHVFSVLDHRHINEVFIGLGWPGETTAENIVRFVWSQLEMGVRRNGASLLRVRLWETATSFAEKSFDDEVFVNEEPTQEGGDQP